MEADPGGQLRALTLERGALSRLHIFIIALVQARRDASEMGFVRDVS